MSFQEHNCLSFKRMSSKEVQGWHLSFGNYFVVRTQPDCVSNQIVAIKVLVMAMMSMVLLFLVVLVYVQCSAMLLFNILVGQSL